MAVFKCKMCGGTLEINNSESVATCEYCGTQQTLPRLDDEKRANEPCCRECVFYGKE